MRWKDIPESENIEDRRDPKWKPKQKTMAEMTADADKERKERDPTLQQSELGMRLGRDDIGKSK